jgi:hypothetical protein
MSKMMLKMLADMAGVSPEEIMANVEQFRETALAGVQLLQQIDGRLARIEKALNIEPPVNIVEGQFAVAEERQE